MLLMTMKIIKFIGEQALTGTYIRNNYGFVAVFSTGCATILLAIIFVIFILKESISQDTRERDDKTLQFKGFIGNLINQNLMRTNVYCRLLQRPAQPNTLRLQDHLQE